MTTDTAFLRTETLPDEEYGQYFDDIVIPDELKQLLVNHGKTIQQLHDADVNPRRFACTGVVVLYGPQGTGKTSLGRGVPNELAKRLDHEIVFRSVDANQLFSGDLGASPEAVADVFDTIIGDAEQDRFQCILFDEVEALLHSRDQLSTDTDPTDVTRCVLTVLQRLDDLIDYPNVLVYATSNQPDVLDTAFLDRADLRLEVGPPTAAARAVILSDVFAHLNTQLGTDLPTHPAALNNVVDATEGTSARTLRNLAFGAMVFGDDPDDLSYEDVRSFLAHGRLEDDGITLSTTDDRFAVDTDGRTARDAADVPLTFVYDRQATANTVRADIPDEFQTGRYDRRYKRIQLCADTPAEWLHRAAEDAVDIVQSSVGTSDNTPTDRSATTDASQDGEPSHRETPFDFSSVPRVAVYNQRTSNATATLLDKIGRFAAETVAQTGHAAADTLDDVLCSDRVRETVFPFVQLEALQGVEFTVDGFTFQVDIAYDAASSEFLEPLSSASLPSLDDSDSESPLAITLIVDENGHAVADEIDACRFGDGVVTLRTRVAPPAEVTP